MWFDKCRTPEEAAGLYRALARENHPDRGGDTRTMQDISAEYATWQASHARTEAKAHQEEAHAQGKKSAADYHDIDKVAEALRVKILFALNLTPAVTVEPAGLWVWVSGDTRQHKEALKEAGFKWAHDKAAWYFAGVPSFNRTRRTLEEIRQMHGSIKFQNQPADDERAPIPAGALHS